jgi:ComF family protein
MQAVKTIAKNIINLLYPIHCFGCGTPLDPLDEFRLCGHCSGSIKYNAMPPFELDTLPVKAYSACLYEGTLKELIHKFKYKDKTILARIFSKFMIDHIRENPELACADFITVVPLHKTRLREREFNQSLLLTGPVSKELCLPVKNVLEKTRRTKYQNELLKGEREINLKGAFKVCDDAQVAGQKILLIDDVMTTGATLGECAKTLLTGGAKSVMCFTLARGI